MSIYTARARRLGAERHEARAPNRTSSFLSKCEVVRDFP
jgi:hypothetical protein